MNIIFVNQYYTPDLAPTGRVLGDLAVYMAQKGHEVTVISSCTSYRSKRRYPGSEVIDGVNVRSLPVSGFSMKTRTGAILNYLSFYMCLWKNLSRLETSPDLIVAMSSPPLTGLIVKAIAGKKNWRYGHWVMNIVPGLSAERMESRQWDGSSLVLTICAEMAERLKMLGADDVQQVPLWAHSRVKPVDAKTRADLRTARGWSEDDLVLMYSGNMGMPHSFGEIRDAVERTCDDRTIRWVFYGDGKKRSQVDRIKDMSSRVEVNPYVSSSDLAQHMASADVHIVSLKPDWQGYALPCKIHDIMMSGGAVIFIGDEHNSIADWIREAECGWITAPGDVDGLLSAIDEARDSAERTRRGRNGRSFAEKHFLAPDNCDRICKLLETAAAG